MPHRHAALVTLALALLVGSVVVAAPVAEAAPAAPGFGATIEPLAAYVGQEICDPPAKPGASAFRDLVLRAYPGTTSLGISRDCAIGGRSEHKEGRGWDWGVNAQDPAQMGQANDLLSWLLAPDQYRNAFAMARRLGIMYMIWNRQIWRAYAPDLGWQPYSGPNPHTDHVHFSLSWDGAWARTSWYIPLLPIAPTPALRFHPLSPVRILDSRPGSTVGPYATPWGPATTRPVTVAGLGGVPATAGAVALNVTVTSPSEAGFLTIWPYGQARPQTSILNWARGQTVPNAVTVKVGSGGRVAVFSSSGSTNVIVDVVGSYDADPGDGLTPLTPTRVFDSRQQQGAPWDPGEVRNVSVTGGQVPADADAVVANVTVTNTTSSGFLALWPAGTAPPMASSLNWSSGQTIANSVTAKVGAGGNLSVFNESGTADVIVDVVGFFASGSGGSFHPVSPSRIQDSRWAASGPYASPWGPGTTRAIQVTGVGNIPSGAAAALLNVTATDTTATSFLTTWPAQAPAPDTSSLNWQAGQTVPNAVTSRLSAGGAISVANAAGTVDVIADTAGWYE
ncbi:MAG: hypothetical protein ABIS47_14175 [Acidimicrobiales bacterium]